VRRLVYDTSAIPVKGLAVGDNYNRWRRTIITSGAVGFSLKQSCPPFLFSQAALEKFEYLPIKCQVMRGRHTYLKFQEDLEESDFWGHTLKTKVQQKLDFMPLGVVKF
jgi:hypothetical protein